MSHECELHCGDCGERLFRYKDVIELENRVSKLEGKLPQDKQHVGNYTCVKHGDLAGATIIVTIQDKPECFCMYCFQEFLRSGCYHAEETVDG